MTEQEALNDPEMKIILLISGYVRDLSEGKDYESTTYKLAETITKVFSMHYVNQHDELLDVLGECRKWIINRGVNVESEFFKRINKITNK